MREGLIRQMIRLLGFKLKIALWSRSLVHQS